MSSGKTCCLCLPLECGIMTLAVLTILETLGWGVDVIFIRNTFSTFWPMIVAMILMSIVWIVVLIDNGE